MFTPGRTSQRLCAVALLLAAASAAQADVNVPSIIGDNMVLQRGQSNRLWGWADQGEKVTVTLGDQSHQATAADNGRWEVTLEPLPAGGPHELTVKGSNTLSFKNVLVGEVWICSGQSNMAWPVGASYDADLEIMSAKYPQIRLISVPQVGSQEPKDDFKGSWSECSPETVGNFSAVGYFFGRRLHQILGVPVGLIDNAWGGSSADAWVPRETLEADDRYAALMQRWKQTEETYDHEAQMARYKQRLEKWEEQQKAARKAGKALPRRPRQPRNPLAGQHRPGNLYNGVLHPTIGYGIRGVIWYQGESNAGRAYQYRHLFPLMIQTWRDAWKQGDFPFYWVQLADFRSESDQPQESAWAELREAQTMAADKLPNTGEAVIIQLGEGRDIHPRNKQDVAERLARWALARDYGHDVPYRSPRYRSMEKDGDKITLTFDHVGSGLYTFDVNEPIGFAIAGEDKNFVWANARLIGKDKVQVWSDRISDPVAVRYGWADNPVCNLQSREGLYVTPFRTDDWPGVTANVNK